MWHAPPLAWSSPPWRVRALEKFAALGEWCVRPGGHACRVQPGEAVRDSWELAASSRRDALWHSFLWFAMLCMGHLTLKVHPASAQPRGRGQNLCAQPRLTALLLSWVLSARSMP